MNEPQCRVETGPADLTVYFDGSCPLCRREIGMYRHLPSKKPIQWLDVSRPAELGEGLNCARAMARFHVRDAQGRLYSGGAAFAQLWLRLPGWRWLGRIGTQAPLSWLLEAAYRGFLPIRPYMQRAIMRFGR